MLITRNKRESRLPQIHSVPKARNLPLSTTNLTHLFCSILSRAIATWTYPSLQNGYNIIDFVSLQSRTIMILDGDELVLFRWLLRGNKSWLAG